MFLEPSTGCNNVSLGYYLKMFALTYLQQSKIQPSSNLIRKHFHTVLLRLSREDKLLDLLSKVDAHSKAVAKKVYCTTTLTDDAHLGKMLFETLYGDPVEWPTSEITNQQMQLTLGDLAVVPWDQSEEQNVQEETSKHEDEYFLLWEEVLFTKLDTPVLADDGPATAKPIRDSDIGTDIVGTTKPNKAQDNKPKKESKPKKEAKADNPKKEKKCKKENKRDTDVVKQEEPDQGIDNRDSVEPPKKRGRPSPFEQQHKDWIIGKCKVFGCMLPKPDLEEITNEGVNTSALPKSTQMDQVRNVCRKHFGC